METNGQKQAKTDAGELSQQQLAAVDLLSSGRTITDTAAALDLRRQTVSDWLNHIPTFQAALSSRRNELWIGASDRLRTLADRAIDVLAECLESEGELRFKAGVAILKACGLYGSLTAPQGLTDVEALEIEQQRQDYTRRVRREELEIEQKSQDYDRVLRHLAAGGG